MGYAPDFKGGICMEEINQPPRPHEILRGICACVCVSLCLFLSYLAHRHANLCAYWFQLVLVCANVSTDMHAYSNLCVYIYVYILIRRNNKVSSKTIKINAVHYLQTIFVFIVDNHIEVPGRNGFQNCYIYGS